MGGIRNLMLGRDVHKPTVAVTGATGFVGADLCKRLAEGGFAVRAVVRRLPPSMSRHGLASVEIGDVRGADWMTALAGVDYVVHLAARVHMIEDRAADPLTEFRRTNVAVTRSLARAAAKLGVRRMVYLSSIKVNGEGPTAVPYRATDPPSPVDPYGISKLEAERALNSELSSTGTSYCIIRPPLVYGPGVRANFLRLIQWIDRGIPLPFGCIKNRRSFVFVGNLNDLILRCITNDGANNGTFLVSDGDDLSTPELVRRIADAIHRPHRLPCVPRGVLRLAAQLLGRDELMRRLCDSLMVDATPTRERLDWRPPYTIEGGLTTTADWYLGQKQPPTPA